MIGSRVHSLTRGVMVLILLSSMLQCASISPYSPTDYQYATSPVDKIKVDLERWSQLLASGALSKDDFAWLVQGKKDLAELEALEQAGLALARLDHFRTDLVNLVVDTVFSVFVYKHPV